ncbi:TAXI family TRAP transporter solute-binding subunit [Vreelandella stevensii]|uniref:TAXI family TRAP transporter solute-binding subunit n=1 Tax=Vreelandella stevensii TaxID=502821 RepID=UPI00403AAF83
MRASLCSLHCLAGLMLAAVALLSSPALAEPPIRVTYKSALAGTAYHQMGGELAQAIQAGSAGALLLSSEESQGSVQNIMEVMHRQGLYVFTAPPALIAEALEGQGPFAGRDPEHFAAIRGLFPVPPLTMHFVMAGDRGTAPIEALEGKHVLLGRGTFSSGEAARYFELFGLAGKVRLADASITNASEALRDGRIDAYVTASSFPTPNVMETASLVPITLISLTDEQVERTGAVRQIIPGGTYPGIDKRVVTTSSPVFALATVHMDEDVAYRLTKTFWEQQAALTETSAWWGSVTAELLAHLPVDLHPGALRYYEEAEVELPEALR